MKSQSSKSASPSVIVNLVPPELSSGPTVVSVDSSDFQPKPEKRKKGRTEEDYMLIGFDTEYVVPPDPVDSADIREGRAKYNVLSYQFHCILKSGESWSGIAIPNDGERMSMAELIVFALGSRSKSGDSSQFPRLVYLVGHYTKADVPAFSDFKDLKSIVSAVRGSFVSVDSDHQIALQFADAGEIELKIKVRDTYLLSPTGSQALAQLGEMLDVKKVQLHADPAVERQKKSRMDVLRAEDWDLYRRYAIQDAVVCAEYARKIIDLCKTHLGKETLPITLTSIGVDMLLKTWEESGLPVNDILGKETSKEKKWHKKRGHFLTLSREVPQVQYDLFATLATECYHGGRNEQYWFGPGFEDQWTDYDLSSAYATGMALIGRPDWSNIETTRDPERFQIETLGYALVDFEFPENVRFPSLPIRTDNGLVFPRKGTSFCAAPEIFVARSLGAKLDIKQGVIVASDPNQRVFGDYIARCIAERRKHPKKSLSELFWKELSNSTYGKTAQGLREKRVYDSRSMETVPLPPSKITNPYFAAFITSFVRAVIGEVLNALPNKVCVFSCTTDGFLTNATAEHIGAAVQGPVAKIYGDARHRLTGDAAVLEIKHTIRQPLGWRTRGQATLIPGNSPNVGMNTVLAKGGIHLSSYFDSVSEQNSAITKMFFERTPTTSIKFESLLGIRYIVEHDTDLVRKEMSRRVNMEFDWKRKPELLFNHEDYKHCAFSTLPWDTFEQFQEIRDLFDRYQEHAPICIKTVTDFDGFSYYVEARSQLEPANQRYLRRNLGDIKRLRMALCSAWHQSLCEVRSSIEISSASLFAEALTDSGIRCGRTDVENGKKKLFVENSVPKTEHTLAAVSKLKGKIPDFEPSRLWSSHLPSVSALPSRRPYRHDVDEPHYPQMWREFLSKLRYQRDVLIKSLFETPREELRKNIPYWEWPPQ